MNLKKLRDFDVKNKTVLLRSAYDVPLCQKRGKWVVADDTRIQASLPTLRYLLKQNCKIIILTWLGRPEGKEIEKNKLDPVAHRLSECIKRKVHKIDSWDFTVIRSQISIMKPKEILLLENVRFTQGEYTHDPEFAKELSTLADCVVFDAFEQSHRDVPSTTGILKHLPSCVGFHMERELTLLEKVFEHPKAPFIVVLGGAKISDKLDTLIHLLSRADCILIGGAMAHNFLKARGVKVASSYVESDAIDDKQDKKHIFEQAEKIELKTKDIFINLGQGFNIPKLVLPLDLVAASKIDTDAKTRLIDLSGNSSLPSHWMYLDIGPQTCAYYASIISKAKTIFWNGPMGYYEVKKFSDGTQKIAEAIFSSKGYSIVGGGDTEGFLRKNHLEKKFGYVSSSGGALLEFLSGKQLPVLKYLVSKL